MAIQHWHRQRHPTRSQSMRATFQSGIWLLSLLLLTARAGLAAAPESKVSKKPKRTADVVYVATPHDVVVKMLDVAGVTKDDMVYDLGCGDGRIVIMAARRHGCRGVGFDIAVARVEESRRNARRRKVEHLVKIEQQDIFELDLTPASVVTLYLLPEMNAKLVPQLRKLRPGSRIVAHDFGINGVEPDEAITMTSKEDGVEHRILLWTAPLKKAG
jgi:SAM-dependent methyltransferase